MAIKQANEKDWEAKVQEAKNWREQNPAEWQEWFDNLVDQNKINNIVGSQLGWWDIDENFEIIAPPILIYSSELSGNSMAHAVARAGFFSSVSQARKNGWDKPIELGIHTVNKKKRTRIKIV